MIASPRDQDVEPKADATNPPIARWICGGSLSRKAPMQGHVFVGRRENGHRRRWSVVPTVRCHNEDVVTFAPLGNAPGLIPYECPKCGHVNCTAISATHRLRAREFST